MPLTQKRSAVAKRGKERYYLWGDDPADPYADWIDVKAELTYGEQSKLAGSLWDAMQLTGDEDDDAVSIKMDVAYNGPAKLEAWLIDWSVADDDGNILPLDWDTIVNELSPVYAQEMHRIINEHTERIGAGSPLALAPAAKGPGSKGRPARQGRAKTS